MISIGLTKGFGFLFPSESVKYTEYVENLFVWGKSLALRVHVILNPEAKHGTITEPKYIFIFCVFILLKRLNFIVFVSDFASNYSSISSWS